MGSIESPFASTRKASSTGNFISLEAIGILSIGFPSKTEPSRPHCARPYKLLELFREEVNDQNFFSLLPDNELWRILNWWVKSKTERKALDKLLKKRLNGNADFALKLLKVFTPTITGYGSEGPKTYKAGFYQNNFDAVKNVVDVKLLNDNLVTLYGMNPYEKEPTTVSDHEPIDDKTLIAVFQWFINKDLA